MLRSTFFVLGVALAASFSGCSGSGGGGDGGSHDTGTAASPATCYRQCSAQDAVPGCGSIALDDCRFLCDSEAEETPAECADEFDGYYTCSEAAGFECMDAETVQQKGNACTTEHSALFDCQSRVREAGCEGVGVDGHCPMVDCPCPGGVVPTSGYQNDHAGGTCRCLDATTCLQTCGAVSIGGN